MSRRPPYRGILTTMSVMTAQTRPKRIHRYQLDAALGHLTVAERTIAAYLATPET